MISLFLQSVCSEKEFGGSRSSFFVQYYTMIKLQHDNTKFYLSTTPLRYINGSHQNIVFGTKKGILAETFWTVYPLENQTDIQQGEPIQCGTTLRLKNSAYQMFLHSHAIEGPFNKGQEVSAFAQGDNGDLWTVECDDMWTAATPVYLKHFETEKYLSATNNIYPPDMLEGYEVYAEDTTTNNGWYIQGGIFIGDDEE